MEQFGPTARGADWNSRQSQELRFSQLTRIIVPKSRFSVIDYGCGYGALIPFLLRRFSAFQYLGFDWSAAMIAEATRLYGQLRNCRFVTGGELSEKADYTVASGIFNVKLDHPEPVWKEYVIDTLHRMDGLSEAGFSFNILTGYCDPEYKRSDLFYADPCFFFDYCKRKFSKQVALLHDYGLYDFTILVRKEV
jgi:SAM-dependent methyltransferase